MEIRLVARPAAAGRAHSGLAGGDSPLERMVSVLEHLRRDRERLIGIFRQFRRHAAAEEGAWSGVARAEPQVRILGLRQPARDRRRIRQDTLLAEAAPRKSGDDTLSSPAPRSIR